MTKYIILAVAILALLQNWVVLPIYRWRVRRRGEEPWI